MTERKQLELLFHAHYRRLYLLASMMLHDEAESKDIVHDVFAHLMECGRSLQDGTAEAYLTASVRNRCLNRIRSMKIQKRVERGYILDHQMDDCTDPAALEAKLNAMESGLARLRPPQCREVLKLHYHDRLTFRQVAMRLNVSETMVYNYLRSALRQLREQLKNL